MPTRTPAKRPPGSDNVLPTQETIDRLADRIERAFRLRRCNWVRGCSTPRIWSAAATVLWQVHNNNPEIPLDPELYVASQPIAAPFGDPWTSLARAEAGQRYRQNVRRIIRRLHSELSREVRRAEEQLRKGRELSVLIRRPGPRISPLGLYITAHRAGRADLAQRLRLAAIEQHNCCPLYRPASLALIPAALYPSVEQHRVPPVNETHESPRMMASLN
jgi:hypothetical protein